MRNKRVRVHLRVCQFIKSPLNACIVLAMLFGASSFESAIANPISLDVFSIGDHNKTDADVAVSGTVVDEKGQTLPGVNVIEKGTTNGTTTDVSGNFSLTVRNENAVLVFSFIGYVTQELAVGNRTVFDVNLSPDVTSLEEVVVVGYGEQKKVNLTGSVATVSADELIKRPAANVQNLLQGKVTGLQVVQNSGQPGDDGATMTIRGLGTFSDVGNSPLVLIDGV